MPLHDRSARILGLHLGLGDLHRPEACMGYQNACVCRDCLERARTVEPAVTPAQPWEPRNPIRKAA